VARRSFLSRLASGAALVGLGTAPARAQTPPAAAWSPAAHADDDWYARVPGQHRFFFDTTSTSALGNGIVYASNYFTANREGYGLADSDLAVVICLRHFSTPFAFNDAMWAKYGAPMARAMQFTDPKTNQPPTTNVYLASDYGPALPNRGITLATLAGRGVQYAVCGMATRAFSGIIAQSTGGDAGAIFQELVANSVPNSHMVTAGIVAVNRAQERGYSLAYVEA
jgi:hypothetical protein